MRRYGWLVIGVVALALWAWQQRAPTAIAPASMPSPAAVPARHVDAQSSSPPFAQRDDVSRNAAATGLPREALATLQRIDSGGPHPYRQDGGSFQNRERLLPARPRGYYREYTVQTPGSRDRGARRIVTGGEPPSEFFYSDDHYRSFRRIDAGRRQ
jgi:guanyl-specific ribonuclease Sa